MAEKQNPQSPAAAQAASADAAKKAARAADEARDAAEQSVGDQRKAMLLSNAAAMERMDNSRPTPTQEENDLARVGALDHDAKEDDGSPDEQELVDRTMLAKSSGLSYDTREMAQRGEHAKQRQAARKSKK